MHVVVITVPTPLREGVPDLSCIEAAGEAPAAHLRPGATVLLESTTYPDTAEELLAPLLEKGSGLTAGGPTVVPLPEIVRLSTDTGPMRPEGKARS
ncbi:hypothetical protein [Kitasatospora sp. HPMI-4]|uniref:hypothetical protein n=1 Tax=Kitasatospora sp. HPMI-4 TaxID=3448443 RepID=UPI003F1DF96F